MIDVTGRKVSLTKRYVDRLYPHILTLEIQTPCLQLGVHAITSDPLLTFYSVFEAPPSPDSPHTDTDHRTTIETTPSGWFYSALLSLSPPARTAAFHTLPPHPSAKRARRREGFLDLLHVSSSHKSTIITTNNYEIALGGLPRCPAAGSSYLDTPCRSEDRWFAVAMR